MDVILTQSVAGVGKAGENHKVADGYGRNYLIPRKLAVPASKGNMRNLARIQEDSLKREAESRSAAEVVFGKVDGQRLLMPARVSTDGSKLYGSITPQDIANSIEKATGEKLDKRIVLTDAIKQIGTFKVPVRVYAGLVANVEAVVYPEGQQPPAKKVEVLPDPEVAVLPEPAPESAEVMERAEEDELVAA